MGIQKFNVSTEEYTVSVKLTPKNAQFRLLDKLQEILPTLRGESLEDIESFLSSTTVR
jgi:hypothetical protein